MCFFFVFNNAKTRSNSQKTSWLRRIFSVFTYLIYQTKNKQRGHYMKRCMVAPALNNYINIAFYMGLYGIYKQRGDRNVKKNTFMYRKRNITTHQ